jgi:hypothetical protein
MTTELKPCPWCNKPARCGTYEGVGSASCNNDYCPVGPVVTAPTEAEAVELWNRRSAASAEPAMAWAYWHDGQLDSDDHPIVSKRRLGETMRREPWTERPLCVASAEPTVAVKHPCDDGCQYSKDVGMWPEHSCGNGCLYDKSTPPSPVVSEEMVERALDALVHDENYPYGSLRKAMRAALNAALSPAPAGEDGWMPLPTSPTGDKT